MLYPFTSKEDCDFFQHLEMHMRQEHPPLLGRDHLAFRWVGLRRGGVEWQAAGWAGGWGYVAALHKKPAGWPDSQPPPCPALLCRIHTPPHTSIFTTTHPLIHSLTHTADAVLRVILAGS